MVFDHYNRVKAIVLAIRGNMFASLKPLQNLARFVVLLMTFASGLIDPGLPANSAASIGPVKAVTVSGYSAKGVFLSWQSPVSGASKIDDYALQYSKDGRNWKTGSIVPGSSRSGLVPGLSVGATYSFRVVAQDDADAIDVSTGGEHTCAVLSNGAVKCWGRGDGGQLGNGAWKNASTPVTVKNISNAVSVGAGADFTCALLKDHTVDCWGSNTYGQLGPAATRRVAAPQKVSGLTAVTQIAVGGEFACALVASGGVWCWGDNSEGQLGSSDRQAGGGDLVQIWAVSQVKMISASSNSACAISIDGDLACWGANNGPSYVESVSPVSQASTYESDLCYVSAEQSHCIGDFGDAVTEIPETQDVLAASAGFGFACDLHTNQDVYCFGDASSGALGNGESYSDKGSRPARKVAGIGGIVKVSVADFTVCALAGSGAVYCWGNGAEGALGDGYSINEWVPVKPKNVFSKSKVTSSISATLKVKLLVGQKLIPKVSFMGAPASGSTLTALPGKWDAGVSLSYAWLLDGLPIRGATARTLQLNDTFVGHLVSVRITGTKKGVGLLTCESNSRLVH